MKNTTRLCGRTGLLEFAQDLVDVVEHRAQLFVLDARLEVPLLVELLELEARLERLRLLLEYVVLQPAITITKAID